MRTLQSRVPLLSSDKPLFESCLSLFKSFLAPDCTSDSLAYEPCVTSIFPTLFPYFSNSPFTSPNSPSIFQLLCQYLDPLHRGIIEIEPFLKMVSVVKKGTVYLRLSLLLNLYGTLQGYVNKQGLCNVLYFMLKIIRCEDEKQSARERNNADERVGSRGIVWVTGDELQKRTSSIIKRVWASGDGDNAEMNKEEILKELANDDGWLKRRRRRNKTLLLLLLLLFLLFLLFLFSTYYTGGGW